MIQETYELGREDTFRHKFVDDNVFDECGHSLIP